MKKIIILSFALIAVLFTVSCNREDMNLSPDIVNGEYTLDAITCTLDGSSKTSIQPDGVVYWQPNDRIAVIGTNGIRYYIIEKGAGTPIGQFRPFSTPATYTNVNDLTAVYPAVALVNQNTLRINTDVDPNEALEKYGLSWDPESSPFSFANNDIKIAKPSLTTEDGTTNLLNFKFTQLGTWCRFTFDFTGADLFASEFSKGEDIKRISIRTSDGKNISGSTILPNGNNPIISSGSENTLTRVYDKSSPSIYRTTDVYFMLYPIVKLGDVLEIELETSVRIFKFYGKVKTDFKPGTTLNFPIQVDKNFILNSTAADRYYTSTLKPETPFYYYGDANCLLLNPAQNQNGGSLNIAAYQTNRYFEKTNTPAPTTVPRATKAEVIWEESAGFITKALISGDILTVEKQSGIYGNALVGIYDASDNLLWSYHIWAPEDIPETKVYSKIVSGTSYNVLDMPIGAIKRVTASSSDEDKLNAIGLYYQWGRKDPLGRGADFSRNAIRPVYDKNGNEMILANDGRGYITPHTASVPVLMQSYNPTTDGTILNYLIRYTISNPTHFLTEESNNFSRNWAGEINNYLWGNPWPSGTFPTLSQTYKSIFDPSPAGYKVVPEDTYMNFTQNHNNSSYTPEFNIANPGGIDATNIAGSDKGYAFYYEGYLTGNTHFYVTTGYREQVDNVVRYVGSNIMAWTSATHPSNGNAIMLYAIGNGIHVRYNFVRARGHNVFCVKEL